MKHIVLLLILFIPLLSKAQQVDTICTGGVKLYYMLDSTMTYKWQVTKGGMKMYSDSTDSFFVKFDSISGYDTVSLIMKNKFGCIGLAKAVVYKMPRPTATMSGVDTICYEASDGFKVTLTGKGPWDFTYTDGTDTVSVKGDTANPYFITTKPLTGYITYTFVPSLSNSSCTQLRGKGSHSVYVLPKLSPVILRK